MKRSFCLAFLLIAILALTSCSDPPTLKTDFSTAFSTRYGDTDYTGTLTKKGSEFTVALTGPCTVQGMVFAYRDGSINIDYGGHSTGADTGYLPCESIPAALHETLALLSQAEYRGSDDSTDSFTLPTPHGSAEIRAKDGAVKLLTVPAYHMTFEFDSADE